VKRLQALDLDLALRRLSIGLRPAALRIRWSAPRAARADLPAGVEHLPRPSHHPGIRGHQGQQPPGGRTVGRDQRASQEQPNDRPPRLGRLDQIGRVPQATGILRGSEQRFGAQSRHGRQGPIGARLFGFRPLQRREDILGGG